MAPHVPGASFPFLLIRRRGGWLRWWRCSRRRLVLWHMSWLVWFFREYAALTPLATQKMMPLGARTHVRKNLRQVGKWESGNSPRRILSHFLTFAPAHLQCAC